MKIITVLQRGALDKLPKPVRTRADFINARLRFEFTKMRPFTPVKGVEMVSEPASKYENFVLDGEQIYGLAMFFGNGIKELTKEQQERITAWFKENT